VSLKVDERNPDSFLLATAVEDVGNAQQQLNGALKIERKKARKKDG